MNICDMSLLLFCADGLETETVGILMPLPLPPPNIDTCELGALAPFDLPFFFLDLITLALFSAAIFAAFFAAFSLAILIISDLFAFTEATDDPESPVNVPLLLLPSKTWPDELTWNPALFALAVLSGNACAISELGTDLPCLCKVAICPAANALALAFFCAAVCFLGGNDFLPNMFPKSNPLETVLNKSDEILNELPKPERKLSKLPIVTAGDATNPADVGERKTLDLLDLFGVFGCDIGCANGIKPDSTFSWSDGLRFNPWACNASNGSCVFDLVIVGCIVFCFFGVSNPNKLPNETGWPGINPVSSRNDWATANGSSPVISATSLGFSVSPVNVPFNAGNSNVCPLNFFS